MDGTLNSPKSWLMLVLVACWWLAAPSIAKGGPLPPSGLSSEAWQAITDSIERDFSLGQPTASSAPGDVVYESAKLLASDGASGDDFGYSVAVSGDTVAVGAWGQDDQGSRSGSAYVFEQPASGWSGTLNEAAKLLPSDGASGERFGWSVAVSGDTVVVGAYDDSDQGWSSGSAYVFEKPVSGWFGVQNEAAKLLASDGTVDRWFGYSVSISGDTVVVGANHDDEDRVDEYSGSAYVFEKPAGGWSGTLSEAAKLLASDGTSYDEFGRSVAVSGDTVVVGAVVSAYVFLEPVSGWSGTLYEDTKLLAGVGGGYFGYSVAVSGDTVVVGAYWHDDQGANSGSGYVFEKPVGGWSGTLSEDAKLLASDGARSDFFGRSVSISGETVVVGAWWDDTEGSAYVFGKPSGGWYGTLNEDAKLLASDGAAEDDFGLSVAVSGNTVVVGAPYDDDQGLWSGSAYVFAPPDSDGDGVLDELDVCADTVIPEGVPAKSLGRNRFALVDDDGVFDTNRPPGRGPEVGFTIEETAGCSCEQIIDALGLGKGHEKFGCSLGAMEAWVELVNP